MSARGQAAVETALGLLLVVPVMLFGVYLAEVALERMRVTRLAAEPLWDATAWPHHDYQSASFDTPSATSAAQADATLRVAARTGLFAGEQGVRFACSGANQGPTYRVAATSAFYRDLGGARCGARVSVAARFLPSGFVESPAGGLFRAPLATIRRSFELCETPDCQGFTMLMDDWGLTNRNGEGAECAVSLGGCANPGFFRAGKTVYDAHRSGAGSQGRADVDLIRATLGDVPSNLASLHDFQMSFRGEESGFTEAVGVDEGRADWATTPATTPWATAWAARSDRFLGR